MRNKVIYALIAVCGIALDQLVKLWARTDLMLRPGGEVAVWPGVFYLRYVENTGAAFGIFKGHRWIFIVLTALVVLAIVCILFIRKPNVGLMPGIPIAAILAGAAGNLIDRVFLGYVTDLFDARIIQFAIFNVADSLLVCSVIIVAIWVIRQEIQAKKSAEANSAMDQSAKEEP